jgi:ABC-type uncharacterized transport system involved in gliding motility auxiliary subunit
MTGSIDKNVKSKTNLIQILTTLTLVFAVGALVVRTAYPEPAWIFYVVLGAFVACLLALAWNLRGAFNRRTAAFGVNSATTVLLVLGLLGVANFLAMKYPKKLDVTKNRVNTLSDQTEKVFKGLTQPVKLVFWAKLEEREKLRPLLDNLKSYSTKVEVENVDPTKEMSRAKSADIRQDATLQIIVGGRDTKIQAPTEEKITNAVIKLLKNSAPILCATTGHGEKDFDSNQPDGYELAKRVLANQAYEIRKLDLVKDGKVPTNCSAVAILGPSKAFFEQELKLVRDYLAGGGAGIIALDLNLKGPTYDASPELTKLVSEWGVEADTSLIVDPVSQALRLEATIPIVPVYSKEISITKEMQGNTIFPLTRPLRIAKALRPGLKVNWLTQTTPNAWAENDLAAIGKGSAKFDDGKDQRGPLYTAVAIDGKAADSAANPAKKNTRIVVIGSSLMAANQWTRFGNNLDLFANAVSWLLEDESLISIRPKEEEGGTIQLSAVQGGLIRLVTVLLLPGIMIVFGIVVWLRRKKL